MNSFRPARLFILLLTLLVTIGRSQQCYYPDGVTPSPDMPCNQSAVDAGGHTPCCNPDMMCLDNGLCMGSGVLSRGSCTDATWGDACPQWCKNENPSGGMPLTPCSIINIDDVVFACNVNATACKDANPPFYVPQGNGVILRGDQVAPLQANGASVAMLVEPSTTLYPAKDFSDKTKVTVTATSTSEEGFTAADVAGAAVGVGAPLLVAMACMAIVIISQRRRLNEAKNAAVERENMGRDMYMRYQPPLVQSARTYSSSPVSAPTTANQQYGRFEEMENNHINEMSNDGGLSEMDARTNERWKTPENAVLERLPR